MVVSSLLCFVSEIKTFFSLTHEFKKGRNLLLLFVSAYDTLG